MRGFYFDDSTDNSGGTTDAGTYASQVQETDVAPITAGYKNLLGALESNKDVPTTTDYFPSATLSPVDMKELKGRYFGSLPVFGGGEDLIPFAAIQKNRNELERKSMVAAIQAQEEKDEIAASYKRVIAPKPYQKELSEQEDAFYSDLNDIISSGDPKQLAALSNRFSPLRRSFDNRYVDIMANANAAHGTVTWLDGMKDHMQTASPAAQDAAYAIDNGVYKDGTPVSFDDFGKLKSKIISSFTLDSLLQKPEYKPKTIETVSYQPLANMNTDKEDVYKPVIKTQVDPTSVDAIIADMKSLNPNVFGDNMVTEGDVRTRLAQMNESEKTGEIVKVTKDAKPEEELANNNMIDSLYGVYTGQQGFTKDPDTGDPIMVNGQPVTMFPQFSGEKVAGTSVESDSDDGTMTMKPTTKIIHQLYKKPDGTVEVAYEDEQVKDKNGKPIPDQYVLHRIPNLWDFNKRIVLGNATDEAAANTVLDKQQKYALKKGIADQLGVPKAASATSQTTGGYSHVQTTKDPSGNTVNIGVKDGQWYNIATGKPIQ